jgi:hypothetical protein
MMGRITKVCQSAICNLQSAILLLIVLVSGCADGHFTVLGYTTKPNYNCDIHTVYVPLFKNDSMFQHLEDELTRVVIQEIEAKTPFKVVNSPGHADTELLGKIKYLNKQLINGNQIGEVREAQTILAVEVVWRDLRLGHEGEILSNPRPAGRMTPPPPPGTPPPPILIQSFGSFIPELGGSIATSMQDNVQRAAIQIVSMMEIWPAPIPPHPGP